MVFYHVTMAENLPSIGTTGIDPTRSKGKLLASWFCDRKRLLWACLHTLKRHGCKPSELVIIPVDTARLAMRRSGRAGLYYSTHVVRVNLSTTPVLDIEDIDREV